MRTLVKNLALLLGLLCFLFFAANRLLFFKQGFLENLAAQISYPFICASSALKQKARSLHAERESYTMLKERLAKTKEQLNAMVDEVIQLRASRYVFDQVKELLEFKQRYSLENKICAKILIRHIAQTQHYYLVNQGSRDGVKKDMVAFYQNHLVGKIVEVYDFYSKILLITDQKSKVSGYMSKSRATGIVQGYNIINRCNFAYVSHLFSVDDNDFIISSGQGLVFPEGFCIGKIKIHSLAPKSLYHHVEIEPMIDLQSLDYCFLADASMIKSF